MKKIKISKSKTGELIADKVEVAETFWARLKGLLGREDLHEGEGMLLYPCKSIHCIGMKFSIDAIFMDNYRKVVGLRSNLEPGASATVYGSQYVLEVEAGLIKEKNVLIGDFLEFKV